MLRFEIIVKKTRTKRMILRICNEKRRPKCVKTSRQSKFFEGTGRGKSKRSWSHAKKRINTISKQENINIKIADAKGLVAQFLY